MAAVIRVYKGVACLRVCRFGRARLDRRRKTSRAFNGRVPMHLEGVMGDANTAYMNGDFDTVR